MTNKANSPRSTPRSFSAIGSTAWIASTKHISRRVCTSRGVFLVCLAGVAAALGYATHSLLTDTEERLAREQFGSITESALAMAKSIANRQKLGLITLASVVEESLPDAELWPFVHVKGFQIIAHNVMDTSSGMSMGFMPIVTPDQLIEFEDYANNVVMRGENAVTQSMYGLDENNQKYNESDGATYWGSPDKIFTPFYQHSSSDAFFLLNWHSIEPRWQTRGRNDCLLGTAGPRDARK